MKKLFIKIIRIFDGISFKKQTKRVGCRVLRVNTCLPIMRWVDRYDKWYLFISVSSVENESFKYDLVLTRIHYSHSKNYDAQSLIPSRNIVCSQSNYSYFLKLRKKNEAYDIFIRRTITMISEKSHRTFKVILALCDKLGLSFWSNSN